VAKVLTVPQADRIPQETGFWCGPASCQTALQIDGQWIEEQQLANEMGTTEDGTPHIGLLADALNAHAHHAEWEAVWMPDDPPSREQCEQFWVDLKANIDSGFAMPANWVSPDNNHPQAVHGSGPNPGYYGTVYHYVCYTGYDEDATGRFVHVADSGFSPWQYWVSFEQACLLMPPKGYVRANAAKAGVPALPGPATELSDAEKLSYAMDESLSIADYEKLLPYVRASLAACECTNENRIAMWFAQIGHESMGLKYFEELADGWAYEGRTDLGNTQPGDGPRFKGRGPIQLTGRSNYTQVSAWAAEHGYAGSPTFFVDQPELLGTWEWGFLGTDWYWVVARPKINAMADAGDIEGVTKAINGGLNGYEDRCHRYERAKQVAAAFLPGTGQPAAPAPASPPPAQQTCLTGRPHHHSENEPTDAQVLNIRAEGLITQALVYAIAEKLGVDAAGLYAQVKGSF
jgi:predicted chitinase